MWGVINTKNDFKAIVSEITWPTTLEDIYDLQDLWARPPSSTQVGRFSEKLVMAAKGEAWGFIDKKGAWVISPSFDGLNSFEGDLAPVIMAGTWGLIDKKGNFVIKPLYQELSLPYKD